MADDTGCAAVVIEKDYYVTMIKIPENEWIRGKFLLKKIPRHDIIKKCQ